MFDEDSEAKNDVEEDNMEAPTPDEEEEEDIPPSQLTHGVRRVINCTRAHWVASFNTFLYIN